MAEAFLYALIPMLALGAVLGLILAVASKRFHVATDERVDRILEVLPGANCGACGFAGCAGYADAIVNGGVEITLCSPGGKTTVTNLANIMGVAPAEAQLNFATIGCRAEGVEVRYDYQGPQDCRAADIAGLAGGFMACRYGCLGLGSCARACPFGAITMGPDKLPHVNEDLCTGCKKCVAACPRALPHVDPEKRVVFVQCRNRDKGAVANKICGHACIACRKCEKVCPTDAIHVIDNLAQIDYDKCVLCGKCVEACPKNVIVNLRAERRERQKRRQEREQAQ